MCDEMRNENVGKKTGNVFVSCLKSYAGQTDNQYKNGLDK